jgi:hypothetical protein
VFRFKVNCHNLAEGGEANNWKFPRPLGICEVNTNGANLTKSAEEMDKDLWSPQNRHYGFGKNH